MRRRTRVAVSAALALLAVGFCLAYAEQVRAESARERAQSIERYGGEVVTLVIAAVPLEAGDVISPADVLEREWVSDLAPDGAITDLDDALGRQVTVPVADGAPLTALNFRDSASMADVPDGHVALSLPLTDKLGLAGAVEVGTPLLAYDVGEKGAKLVSTDMQVLGAPQSTGAVGASASITVAVCSTDVEAVLGASAAGSLRLLVPAEGLEVVQDDAPVAPTTVDPEGGFQNG